MSRLPMLRPREVIHALGKAGFFVSHQRGSHLYLHHPSDPLLHVTVPMHPGDVKRGTLRCILNQAGLTEDEFNRLL